MLIKQAKNKYSAYKNRGIQSHDLSTLSHKLHDWSFLLYLYSQVWLKHSAYNINTFIALIDSASGICPVHFSDFVAN